MKQTGITIFLCLAILFTFVSSAWAADPSFSLDTFNVNFSTPTELSLDNGYIDKDNRTDLYAIKVTVRGGATGQIWKLYVRAADNIFSPGIYGKRCDNLKWKFDHENPNAYRRLKTTNQLMASGAGGKNTTERIDLKMLLDWSDPPASYDLKLIFTLATE